ncbi:MAG: ATP-binding cassette domain-containing protein, partial [Flavobacteriaceae bacterium]
CAILILRVTGEPLSALLAGAASSGLIAIILGPLILRRRGLYFSLLTLAASQIAFEIAFRWTDLTGGDNGLQIHFGKSVIIDNPMVLHITASAVAVLVVALIWRVAHSPFGRVLQGIRENEVRAASIGYSTFAYKYGAFVLSGTLVGVAGGLHTWLIHGAYANYLGWEHAGDSLLMLLLGGAHHFLGGLWGAIAFIVLQDYLSAMFDHWWLVFAPIIIVFTLISPNGIHGLLFSRKVNSWTLVRSGVPERSGAQADARADPQQYSPDQPALSLRNVSKSFGSVVTADNINLDIYPHQLHSLIGPNGAGKTTLFNLISGEMRANGGTISLFGRDITRQPSHRRVRQGLSRSFQIVNAFRELTAFENVRLAVQAAEGRGKRVGFWRDAYDDEAINARTWGVLERVGLAEHGAQVCEHMAHGERRLLEIAITLATDAKVLLLDEPLAGLTESDRISVSNLIRDLSRTHTVFLVEHDIDRVLALSDRISVLHQGRIIADGKPADIAANPDVVTAYLGKPHQTAAEAGAARRAAGVNTAPATIQSDAEPIFEMSGIASGYAGSRILEGINLKIRKNEVVGVLGRNGAGKSTLLYTIMGAVPTVEGQIAMNGDPLPRRRPSDVNRAGISIVPEGRRLFPNLTVAENLSLASRPGGATLEEVFELFPKIKTVYRRKAEFLSGGERQMVAIARALMAPSRLMLLDEPFEGLAPAVIDDVTAALHRLKGSRAMMLVEHDSEKILSLADRIYVLVNGRIAFEGTSAAFEQDDQLRETLLGLGHVENA